jgi:hypothetical protein
MSEPAVEELPEKPVSRACRASMHMHCQDWDGCGCDQCHFTCSLCRKRCRAVYAIPAPQGTGTQDVCAGCYRALSSSLPKGQGCERCGGPRGYRNPAASGDVYLCLTCRRETGTMGRQVTA